MPRLTHISASAKENFKNFSDREIFSFLHEMNEPSYRAGQILEWVYGHNASDFNEMSNLPRRLREELASRFSLSELKVLDIMSSKDGSRKLLFELGDGEMIETVLMQGSSGENDFTLCVSTQVGCAMGCAFCATGRIGLKRNLQHHEIVEQVIAARRILSGSGPGHDDRISNIVFMGMGEPLNNTNAVLRSAYTFTKHMGLSTRKITVSTCGIVPGIIRLAEEGPHLNLAVSLNATTDDVRNSIMPVNRKYPLKELMDACRRFPQSRFRRITFEYVMIRELNDSTADAKRLIQLLRGMKAKVNLISFNRLQGHCSAGMAFEPSTIEKISSFQKILRKAGIAVTIRKSRGDDIAAACGQLRARYK
jgi:23S rRNA (adenine2503-C2)-methyltransferase